MRVGGCLLSQSRITPSACRWLIPIASEPSPLIGLGDDAGVPGVATGVGIRERVWIGPALSDRRTAPEQSVKHACFTLCATLQAPSRPRPAPRPTLYPLSYRLAGGNPTGSACGPPQAGFRPRQACRARSDPELAGEHPPAGIERPRGRRGSPSTSPGTAIRPCVLCPRARQPRRQDPDELRGRLRSDPGPGVRQVVLDGRVRQAESVGGRLLRPDVEDGGHHKDLSVRGAPAGAAISHASRLAAASHSSRPSIGIS